MPRTRRRALLLLAGLLLLIFKADARWVDETLIPAGALWKYNDSGTNLSTGWREPGYADQSWASGLAQLGYGDGDEATEISYGPSTTNRHITYYFRHTFTVASPGSFAAMTARLVRDDGAVLYLNGVEVARSNMPAGTVTYTTLASTAVSGSAESQWFEVPIDPSLLVAGVNVIAVEIHQSSASSSDVGFDLELRATEAQIPPPSVTLIAPSNGAVSNQPHLTFTASVTAPAGLASATLFISGPPNAVMFTGPGQVEDADISADTPSSPNGSGQEINVDGQAPHSHGLLRFPSLIGGSAGQVPAGAVINSATLEVNCTNTGAIMSLYRLTEGWVEDEATWNQRQSGQAWGAAGADGAASHAGVALGGHCSSTGSRLIDITRFVQEWSDGAPNHGIVLTDTGTDGVDFGSSESPTSPLLTVVYKDSLVPLATQVLSGSSALIDFPAEATQAGTWHWNVRVTDSNGVHGWAGTDYVFTADPTLPDEPILVSPLSGSTTASPAAPLRAFVSDPAGGPLSVTASFRRAAGEAFTIVVLPDTQHYSESFPAVFATQTQWVKDNKAARNIVFVTHEGDLVQNAGVNAEWVVANNSMSTMDGVVPYGMAPGNHDQPSTLYNVYFPFTRYMGLPWYGGHYQSLNDNNYQLFSGGGLDFVIVHLEFCPPAGALSWASGVLNSYPNRIGMMTTHGFLNGSAQRTVHVCGDTQYIWDGLVPSSPNLNFILSGHVHDESRRADIAHGHPVYQMLADYQSRPSGGDGWLRILRFVPADNRIYVQTYSPWLNQYETDANSEFTLDFPMAGAFATAGTAVVTSGGMASFTPSGLLPGTEYEWHVTVTNAQGRVRTGPVWRFTTAAGTPVNTPPVAVAEMFTVQGGNSLAVGAPGLLENDTDAEGAALIAELVTGPTHGVLALTADGSFTYTPAAGYAGPDAFTYRVSDGRRWSLPATVTVTVTPAPAPPILAVDFNSGPDGFRYVDDAFRRTRQAPYASGAWLSRGGVSGGAIQIRLGGQNDRTVTNMSGGWRQTFTLPEPTAVTLSFRYHLSQGADYERNEFSQVLASLNGVLVSPLTGRADWIAQIAGNGNRGRPVSTGWQLAEVNLGLLPAGSHTLVIGGFNNRKDSASEQTTILIDDVLVKR